MDRLKINDRMLKFHKQQAFYDMKYHKKGIFINYLQYRLVNPTKNNIEKIKQF